MEVPVMPTLLLVKTVVVPTKIFWFVISVMLAPSGATSLISRSARAVSVTSRKTVRSVIAAGFGTLTLTSNVLTDGAVGGVGRAMGASTLTVPPKSLLVTTMLFQDPPA